MVRAAAQPRRKVEKVQGFNARVLDNSLWDMAATFRVGPEVFDSMCRAAAPKVQGLNAQVLANSLWA